MQARLLLEDPASEESILHQWDTVLPEVLQGWNVHPGQLSAFSDGYRNASLIKDRVNIHSAALSTVEQGSRHSESLEECDIISSRVHIILA